MINTKFSTAVVAATLFGTVSCGTVKTPEMQKYEARQEILEQNLKLNKLKMEYEEERTANNKLREEARSLSKTAENKSDNFTVSNNPQKVADKAKDTNKLLNRAEKANRELVKSDRKLERIQKKIDREKTKAEGMFRQIEYVKPE
ncbi:SlyB protein [Chryseobacterium lacus]|uniref:SlyB protein n=1 Tax=Chryseobacterium lacus TaxID=2058346 RepID=A0A368MZR1_9FLAO|nr:SlyB protein [Chryseobacterium lacus]RCU42469.1 SlyB protein [Chryseobacterium lacus]RST27031.1 SlyB protein [Chryseobacterium lacus]